MFWPIIFIGKKQIVFLIESEDNEIFGYYLNTEVIEEYCGILKPTDSRSFEFNLQSKNNRIKKPMKYEIRFWQYGYNLYEKSSDLLISLGNIFLYKENKKNKSISYQNENSFDYHGIKKALCGKKYPKCFTPKRILIIQMK